ncbi:GntR family transcriptional regulator [Marinitenerispora sediminis]|uniref:GntR family transcriptional regulator n=2 Tax=Marinitenerispora sediminis TaxID=1931232 RepID=A0A368T3I3_9ACTN|nr:GntR family transcriptional regulator [Marinitenerispora sediminis]RCV56864.1 GntR family transcriptional regulator [Marinitenerispora sediminis]
MASSRLSKGLLTNRVQRPVPLREGVYEALLELITRRQLPPGQHLVEHQPTESEADQLLAVRALLETESARLAARNADEAGVARLRELWREGVEALERAETDDMVDANADLHARITELSGNAVLAELAGQVARRVRWYHTLVVRQRGREAWDEHAAIIDAIEAGDEERAAELMRLHTDATRRSYHDQAATPED